MADYGKLIPPPEALVAELIARIDENLRNVIRERILREAGFEDQVTEAIAAIEMPTAAALAEGTRQLFEREPDREWRDHIEAVVNLKTGDDG